MVCPKCGSEKVTAQVVTETRLKDKRHGIIWWIFVGWYWIPVKWLFLTAPALIVKIFAPKKQKVQCEQVSMWICQDCGHTWKV